MRIYFNEQTNVIFENLSYKSSVLGREICLYFHSSFKTWLNFHPLWEDFQDQPGRHTAPSALCSLSLDHAIGTLFITLICNYLLSCSWRLTDDEYLEGQVHFCFSTPDLPLRSKGLQNQVQGHEGPGAPELLGLVGNKILTVYPPRCHNPGLQTWFRELGWAG
jgi:hypothetical protein